MRLITRFTPSLLVLLVAVAMLLVTPAIVREVGYAATSARITLANQAIEGDDILERIDRAQVAIAEAVRPGVVHIDAAGSRRGASSAGAGWVFDDRGHVVTNAHVVRGSDVVEVEFSSGIRATADVIGGDAFTDIAVIQVRRNMPFYPLTRATSEPAVQGQQVFAFGSPFGFKHSMSRGIVSGLGRDARGALAPNGFTNYIQTDAAVNPGNSGGPLVDARGRVVGMNVAIANGVNSNGTRGDGQSAGVGFAIPLQVVENVVEQIIETGDVRRGFLGIGLGPSAEIERDGAYTTGVAISNVTAGSAAQRAGLQFGDVIVDFAGQPTPTSVVLRSIITSFGPGAEVEATVFRGGRELAVEITLDEFPEQMLAGDPVLRELRRNGLALRRDDRTRVSRVVPDSPAATAGLVAGDRIREVNDERIRSADELVIALENAGLLFGAPVKLTVIGESGQERSIDLGR